MYFKEALEIVAWGSLRYLAVSSKLYNKERNAGIVNQRRMFPIMLKELLQCGRV